MQSRDDQIEMRLLLGAIRVEMDGVAYFVDEIGWFRQDGMSVSQEVIEQLNQLWWSNSNGEK